MAVSYKKLWKLLIDKDMKKKDLRVATGMSSASMAKLAKNGNVTIDVLVRIWVSGGRFSCALYLADNSKTNTCKP